MCSPATPTQMFKKWLLIKIRSYNLQSTTSQTWPAGSAVLDEKGISFEGEYECERKINSGKQVRHRWNRVLLVRNNRNRLSSCAISDIGFHGRQNLLPPNRLFFFKLFQAADKRAPFANGYEQHLCLRIGFLLDVTNAEKYHFNAIWMSENFR